MNCPFCAYENSDDATICASCGAPLKPNTDQGIPTAASPVVVVDIPDASLPGEKPVLFDIPPAREPEVERPIVQVYDSGPAFNPENFLPASVPPTVKKSNTLTWVFIAAAVLLVCLCSACLAVSALVSLVTTQIR